MRARCRAGLLALPLLLACAGPDARRGALPAPAGRMLDAHTQAGPRDLRSGYAARTADGGIRMVVEIPAGTLEKWEVKPDGLLHRDLEDGRPRVVQYLPYPCNYGMVPGTLLAKELGGDGDPLDVLLLGPALPRGSLVEVRPVGVIRLVDRGEKDDKILAVAPGTPFAEVRELGDLEARFAGVTAILETWFSSYKGPGKMQAAGFGDRAEAERLIDAARAAFEAQRGR